MSACVALRAQQLMIFSLFPHTHTHTHTHSHPHTLTHSHSHPHTLTPSHTHLSPPPSQGVCSRPHVRYQQAEFPEQRSLRLVLPEEGMTQCWIRRCHGNSNHLHDIVYKEEIEPQKKNHCHCCFVYILNCNSGLLFFVVVYISKGL